MAHSPRWRWVQAPPRRRPRRIAKKIAQRQGYLHYPLRIPPGAMTRLRRLVQAAMPIPPEVGMSKVDAWLLELAAEWTHRP